MGKRFTNLSKFPQNQPIMILLGSLLFLTGCTARTQTPEPGLESTMINITPISVPLDTASPIPLPTQIFKSPIPQPPLTMSEAENVILKLVDDNGGCNLPCIWGLEPGVSSVTHVNEIHTTFAPEYVSDELLIKVNDFDDVGGITYISWADEFQITAHMSFYFKGDETLKLVEFDARSYRVSGSGMDKRLEYVFGYEPLLSLVDKFTLSNSLQNYGEPSSILLAPSYFDRPSATPPSWIWYSVVIIYEEQGFLAEYIMPRRWMGDSLAACVDQIAEITIIGWDPQQEFDLSEVLSVKSGLGIHESNISYFRSLEEATSLTIPDFTEIFSEPDTDACIYTPLDLWPHPTIPD